MPIRLHFKIAVLPGVSWQRVLYLSLGSGSVSAFVYVSDASQLRHGLFIKEFLSLLLTIGLRAGISFDDVS